jgi:hypothetical protein
MRDMLPDLSAWGLPPFLGLSNTNLSSETYDDDIIPIQIVQALPRFFYGDALTAGDDGFWLQPDSNLNGSKVHWSKAPFKINLMGPSDLYLEIDELNNIDETSPFSVSKFTKTTNQTNGRINSAFAKIAIPCTPISQWFDKLIPYEKVFIPPLQRLRKLRVKIRYHNGQPVTFGLFNYTFVLEFTTLIPNHST